MRIFSLFYIVTALIVATVTTFLQVFPATEVITRISNSDGSYYIYIAVLILFLVLTAPLVLILIVYNIVLANRSEDGPEPLDYIGITVRRDKALYGGIFPMDIFVNGERKATVTTGKSRRIALPAGTYTLQAKGMSKSSETITAEIAASKPTLYQVGYRSNVRREEVYIEAIGQPNEPAVSGGGSNHDEFLA